MQKGGFIQVFPGAERCNFCIDLVFMREIFLDCFKLLRQQIIALLKRHINAYVSFLYLYEKSPQPVIEPDVDDEQKRDDACGNSFCNSEYCYEAVINVINKYTEGRRAGKGEIM